MIRFILLVNKQGQTRVSQYHEYKDVAERTVDEVCADSRTVPGGIAVSSNAGAPTPQAEIIRKCLARNEKQVRAAAGAGPPPPRGDSPCAPHHSAPSWSTRASSWCTASTRRCTLSSAPTAPRCACRWWGPSAGPGLTVGRLPRRQNELGLLEFIHLIVETFDNYFEGVVRARGRQRCPAAAGSHLVIFPFSSSCRYHGGGFFRRSASLTYVRAFGTGAHPVG